MYLSCNTLLQGGKYKIVRFLSSGGFGNTYSGVHTMMDTRVAIKEFFPKMFCNRDENPNPLMKLCRKKERCTRQIKECH